MHGSYAQTKDQSEDTVSSSSRVIHLPDMHLCKEDDLPLMKRCIEQYSVPPEFRFSLLTRIRYARAFQSPNLSRLYNKICILVFIALVQSNDAHDELVSFFANEPEYTLENIPDRKTIEGWLTEYLNGAEIQFSPEVLIFLGADDVHIDVAELRNISPSQEQNMVPPNVTEVPKNVVFRGKARD